MADTGITGTTTGVGSVDTTSTGAFLSGTYKGAVGLGQFRASLTMIVGVILAIIMILCGAYMIFLNDDEDYLNVSGRVMSSECLQSKSHDSHGNPEISYKCNVTIGYEIDGKKYSKVLLMKSKEGYLQGELINLWVRKDNHSYAQESGWPKNLIGSGAVCLALVILGLAYLQYYLTYRYEVYAAVQGVGTVKNLLT